MDNAMAKNYFKAATTKNSWLQAIKHQVLWKIKASISCIQCLC